MSNSNPFSEFDKPEEDIPFAMAVPAPEELLANDHTLNGGILFGLDGYVVEIQARAKKYVVGGMLRDAF